MHSLIFSRCDFLFAQARLAFHVACPSALVYIKHPRQEYASLQDPNSREALCLYLDTPRSSGSKPPPGGDAYHAETRGPYVFAFACLCVLPFLFSSFSLPFLVLLPFSFFSFLSLLPFRFCSSLSSPSSFFSLFFFSQPCCVKCHEPSKYLSAVPK